MLHLDFIRQHPDVVREGLQRRRDPQRIDELLRLAEQRRGLVTRCDQLYAMLKSLKETASSASDTQRIDVNRRIKATTVDIRQLELQITDIDTHLQPLLLGLPNIPHESVRGGDSGKSGSGDTELKQWGEPFPYHFEPRPHWDIGEYLGLIDAECGTKIAGSRFVALRGAGAKLERSLISFMLDLHTQEHGYHEIMLPYLVR